MVPVGWNRCLTPATSRTVGPDMKWLVMWLLLAAAERRESEVVVQGVYSSTYSGITRWLLYTTNSFCPLRFP